MIKTGTEFNPSRDIYDLFTPDVSINLAANVLRTKYDSADGWATGSGSCNYWDGPEISLDEKNPYSTTSLETLKQQLRPLKDPLWWATRWYNGGNEWSACRANTTCTMHHAAIPNGIKKTEEKCTTVKH